MQRTINTLSTLRGAHRDDVSTKVAVWSRQTCRFRKPDRSAIGKSAIAIACLQVKERDLAGEPLWLRAPAGHTCDGVRSAGLAAVDCPSVRTRRRPERPLAPFLRSLPSPAV